MAFRSGEEKKIVSNNFKGLLDIINARPPNISYEEKKPEVFRHLIIPCLKCLLLPPRKSILIFVFCDKEIIVNSLHLSLNFALKKKKKFNLVERKGEEKFTIEF